ncbi:protein translocase subunit SecD [Propionibacterium australiense]|uniref:Protein translocase subunit SecD n=1 Tax=Propionibacterium australiense TaxID=119981 RepID=A0A383S2K5_9ACTN|nr:protein translocase subunit SecD [Propionibacterium australiense]RLP11504.1 protein translocase subunit SecD [Propionibacterium australiense]RLP12760.1 protein translocase subunit SecD [Propionibacterium australiense]SYZ32210.1 Protein translocase subunit SecD [secD] [Propionibacterium australiense]VEH90669.1 preprotein translocase subunit SecD [Propionibacterium australiense]
MAARSTTHFSPWKRLAAFGLIVVLLYAMMALTDSWTPRLGLDLRGGTTITLTARNSADGSTPSQDNMETARTIIQNRVDSLGVGESSVTLQGDRQIEVSVPNVSGDELVDLVGTTARLAFRNVYYMDYSAVAQQPESDGEGGADGEQPDDSAETGSAEESASADQASSEPGSGESTAGRVMPELPTSPPPAPTDRPTSAGSGPADFESRLNWMPSQQDLTDFAAWDCNQATPDVEDQPLFACSEDGQYKYLLGPVLISGENVSDATAGVPQNEVSWVVNLDFDETGADQFGEATTYLATQQSPRNQFAIVLDGQVISAPQVSEAIVSGSAQISGGNINQESATALASQLKYGALPIAFDVSSVDTVSPTLGGDQLTAGLIAGAIGLGLVLLYSFLYYRGLGVVVAGSLVAAAVVTWATLVLLGTAVGFAMNLPGIAGAIVAIGVTADSFIVYFERIRDEIRDGYSLRHSIQSGWTKARGTVVMADAVQLLSAAVLFILAMGTVKGFAFTLGVTTGIDLFIVFFFTHPLVTLLGNTKFFGQGRRFSGFEPEHLGVSRASLTGQRRARGGSAATRPDDTSRPADDPKESR